MFARIISTAIATLAITACATPDARSESRTAAVSPEQWAEGCKPWDDWDKPAHPFKVHGNTYYVGTCGIAAILIAGKDEHVLIDTGTKKGAQVVLTNISALNFDPKDIAFIAHSHEHFDHVGGFAFVQDKTGADVVASHAAGPPLMFGKAAKSDPQYGMHDPLETVSSIKFLSRDWSIKLPIESLKWIATPGHSPGALTWQWESCDGETCKTIVYADSLSPISPDGYKFSDHPEYVAAFRAGIARLRALDCDILLTPHPSHSRMIKRAATGSFEGGMTCEEYADSKTKALDARLAKEAAGE